MIPKFVSAEGELLPEMYRRHEATNSNKQETGGFMTTAAAAATSNSRFPIQALDRCASKFGHVVCATATRSSPKASGQGSPIRGFRVMKWPAWWMRSELG
jgi:hypothetical protein